MTLRNYKDHAPCLGKDVYVDAHALVIGDVEIGDDSSVWPMSVVRGDVNSVRIGRRVNIQDGSILHVTHRRPQLPDGFRLVIGDEVTIGHHVILHGCHIHSKVLVGMGSIIMDGAEVGSGTLIGAGSLVTEHSRLEGGYLWLGRPAVKKRRLTHEEHELLVYAAEHYVKLKNDYL